MIIFSIVVALGFTFTNCWYLARIIRSGRYIKSKNQHSKSLNRNRVQILVPVYCEEKIASDTVAYYSQLAKNIGVKICFITSEREGGVESNSTYKAISSLIGNNEILSIRHCPKLSGAKAGQLNWIISQLGSEKIDYFAIFDADSRPDEKGIEFVMHTDSMTDIFQMPAVYLPHMSHTLSSRAASVFQTRWSLCFEVPQWIRWEKKRGVPQAMYLVGHGLFVRPGIRFSEETITEDLELGYRLSAKAKSLTLVPHFDYCRVPKTFSIGVIQSSRWYYGEITSWKVFLSQLINQERKSAYIWRILVRYSQIMLWMIGPWLSLVGIAIAVLNSNVGLTLILILNILIYCYVLHYVTCKVIGLSKLSLILIPIKSLINSLGPILCILLMVLDVTKIKELKFIKTVR